MLLQGLEVSLPSSVSSGLICTSELGCGSSHAAVTDTSDKEKEPFFSEGPDGCPDQRLLHHSSIYVTRALRI